ncbi:hypothetical protein ACFE04_028464 [Oxalis oulophora]
MVQSIVSTLSSPVTAGVYLPSSSSCSSCQTNCISLLSKNKPLPLHLHSRKLELGFRASKRRINCSVEGLYDVESNWSSIWSIRNDLQVPYSPFMGGTYAQGQGDQGPSPMLQERFHSVLSQLFQYVSISFSFNRIIRCGGPVDDDMANIIVSQLLYLDAVDPHKDIVMYVNSPGGSVTAGMAVFDTIRHIRPDVSTVCVGLAASMGSFILAAGTKGKRYSLPNARIMIHQPLGDTQGGQSDIDLQATEMLHHKANLSAYLSYQTGQPLERIDKDTDRDFFMSAEEALEYGIVDGIITNPLKVLQPAMVTAE